MYKWGPPTRSGSNHASMDAQQVAAHSPQMAAHSPGMSRRESKDTTMGVPRSSDSHQQMSPYRAQSRYVDLQRDHQISREARSQAHTQAYHQNLQMQQRQQYSHHDSQRPDLHISAQYRGYPANYASSQHIGQTRTSSTYMDPSTIQARFGVPSTNVPRESPKQIPSHVEYTPNNSSHNKYSNTSPRQHIEASGSATRCSPAFAHSKTNSKSPIPAQKPAAVSVPLAVVDTITPDPTTVPEKDYSPPLDLSVSRKRSAAASSDEQPLDLSIKQRRCDTHDSDDDVIVVGVQQSRGLGVVTGSYPAPVHTQRAATHSQARVDIQPTSAYQQAVLPAAHQKPPELHPIHQVDHQSSLFNVAHPHQKTIVPAHHHPVPSSAHSVQQPAHQKRVQHAVHQQSLSHQLPAHQQQASQQGSSQSTPHTSPSAAVAQRAYHSTTAGQAYNWGFRQGKEYLSRHAPQAHSSYSSIPNLPSVDSHKRNTTKTYPQAMPPQKQTSSSVYGGDQQSRLPVVGDGTLPLNNKAHDGFRYRPVQKYGTSPERGRKSNYYPNVPEQPVVQHISYTNDLTRRTLSSSNHADAKYPLPTCVPESSQFRSIDNSSSASEQSNDRNRSCIQYSVNNPSPAADFKNGSYLPGKPQALPRQSRTPDHSHHEQGQGLYYNSRQDHGKNSPVLSFVPKAIPYRVHAEREQSAYTVKPPTRISDVYRDSQNGKVYHELQSKMPQAEITNSSSQIPQYVATIQGNKLYQQPRTDAYNDMVGVRIIKVPNEAYEGKPSTVESKPKIENGSQNNDKVLVEDEVQIKDTAQVTSNLQIQPKGHQDDSENNANHQPGDDVKMKPDSDAKGTVIPTISAFCVTQGLSKPSMVSKTESKFVSAPHKMIPVANVHPILKSDNNQVQNATEDVKLEDALPKTSKSESVSQGNSATEVFKPTVDAAPQKIQITPNPLFSSHQDEFVRFLNKAQTDKAPLGNQRLNRHLDKEMNHLYRTPESADQLMHLKNLDNLSPQDMERVKRKLALHFMTPKGRHKLLTKQNSKSSADVPLSNATEVLIHGVPPSATITSPPPCAIPDFPSSCESKKLKRVLGIKKRKPKDPEAKKSIKKRNKKLKDNELVLERLEAHPDASIADPATLEVNTEPVPAKKRKYTRRIKTEKAGLTPNVPVLKKPAPSGTSFFHKSPKKKENKSKYTLNRSRRASAYDKNAAYDAELRKEEERRILRRVKRVIPSYDDTDGETTQSGDITAQGYDIRESDVTQGTEDPIYDGTTDDNFSPLLVDEESPKKTKVFKKRGPKPGKGLRRNFNLKSQLLDGLDRVANENGIGISDLLPDVLLPLPGRVLAKAKRRYPMQRIRRRRHREARCDTPVDQDKKRLFVCRETGETTLHKAARKGYVEVALHVLSTGQLDVNVRDNAGYTPLHECSVSGNLAIAKALIAWGADPDIKALDGTRPFHDAVDNDHVELARLLLSEGADPTVANYAGRTPLKIARSTNMKKFLNEFCAEMRDECEPWEIPAFVGKQGSELGYNILADVPSDNDEDDQEGVFFDMSTDKHSQSLFLTLDTTKGPRNYHLLSHITERQGLDNTDDFVLLNGNLQYTEASKVELLEQVDREIFASSSLDCITLRDKVCSMSDDSSVRLVELQEPLCHLLEISREMISTTDGTTVVKSVSSTPGAMVTPVVSLNNESGIDQPRICNNETGISSKLDTEDKIISSNKWDLVTGGDIHPSTSNISDQESDYLVHLRSLKKSLSSSPSGKKSKSNSNKPQKYKKNNEKSDLNGSDITANKEHDNIGKKTKRNRLAATKVVTPKKDTASKKQGKRLKERLALFAIPDGKTIEDGDSFKQTTESTVLQTAEVDRSEIKVEYSTSKSDNESFNDTTQDLEKPSDVQSQDTHQITEKAGDKNILGNNSVEISEKPATSTDPVDSPGKEEDSKDVECIDCNKDPLLNEEISGTEAAFCGEKPAKELDQINSASDDEPQMGIKDPVVVADHLSLTQAEAEEACRALTITPIEKLPLKPSSDDKSDATIKTDVQNANKSLEYPVKSCDKSVASLDDPANKDLPSVTSNIVLRKRKTTAQDGVQGTGNELALPILENLLEDTPKVIPNPEVPVEEEREMPELTLCV